MSSSLLWQAWCPIRQTPNLSTGHHQSNAKPQVSAAKVILRKNLVDLTKSGILLVQCQSISGTRTSQYYISQIKKCATIVFKKVMQKKNVFSIYFRSSAECCNQCHWPQTNTGLSQLKIWLTKWCLKQILRMRSIVLALEHRKPISFPRIAASSLKHINWEISGHTVLVTAYTWHVVISGGWCIHLIL